MSHAAIFSCNLQRNGVSSCLLQEKSPPVNTSSLQNNPTAGHTTTCIYIQFYRSLKYLFHPNLRSKLQEKIASCDSAFSYKLYDFIAVYIFVHLGFVFELSILV